MEDHCELLQSVDKGVVLITLHFGYSWNWLVHRVFWLHGERGVVDHDVLGYAWEKEFVHVCLVMQEKVGYVR